ncbi:MAG: hypothetical protein ACFFBC_05730 [Promethearchaeota archaeon]
MNNITRDYRKHLLIALICCSMVPVIFVVSIGMNTLSSSSLDSTDINLSGGFQSGHLEPVLNLTEYDLQISFIYDGNGLVDDYGGDAHAWAELGIRTVGYSDFNPSKKQVDFIAGGGNEKSAIDVGDILVWNNAEYIYVKYSLIEDWWLTETHVHIASSMEEIPQTKKGNPIPGQFDYKNEHDYVSEFQYQIPLSWLIGDQIYIAAHGVVKYIESTSIEIKESAWASGDEFPGNNWATYFTYTLANGAGVWLATDYDWTANTFDPDPVGSPTQDLDDKLILQREGGHGEADYNLPSTPPNPYANHRLWFDRDGVDQWQAQNPLAIDGGTYNTEGTYEIIITLVATSKTEGTAYLTINGLDQGFETDGDWKTMELSPGGMTFFGDMENMQVFYGLYGYGATHSVSFLDLTVTPIPK